MWRKWALTGAIVLVAIWIIPYSLPILFALLTAVLLEGIIKRLQEKARWRRLYAVLSVFLAYIASLALIISFMVNTFLKQIIAFSQKVPHFAKEIYVTTLMPLLTKWYEYSETLPVEVISSIDKSLENSINSLDGLARNIFGQIVEFVAFVPGLFLEVVIYLIALFLISLELPLLKKKAEGYLTEDTRLKVHVVIEQLSNAGIGFIKAQFILSLATFIMSYIGMLLLQVPYAALIALLIVVVDVLPVLGTSAVLIPWGIIALLQQNETLAIGLFSLFLVIAVVRRIIEPKVYSDHMGISPLAALVSLYIGFKLIGFAGFFLGPLVVIIYDALKKSGIVKVKFKL